MLSQAEIDSAREAIDDALPDTATIQRFTSVNEGGEQTETWTDLTTVACRIAPVGGGETGEAGGRVSDETTHIASFPAGTDVTEADRLVIDGTTYEATLARTRGSWELSRRVECREAP